MQHPNSGTDTGGRGARPLFLAKSILFFTLYTMSEKIFLKLNFDFIVAEIRGVFGSVGVYACVWSHRPTRQISRFYLISAGFKIVAATVFFVLQRHNFDSEAILIPKIYVRLQEITSNFSKFSGEPNRLPAGARAFGAWFGASPPCRPPFQNSWIRPCPNCLSQMFDFFRGLVSWHPALYSITSFPLISVHLLCHHFYYQSFLKITNQKLMQKCQKKLLLLTRFFNYISLCVL